MERTPTGINGFDELIEGGFPKGSFVVVSGGPGSGKTIFATQFIANGVQKFNQKCLYISAEQTRDEIISQAMQFGWDLEMMERENLLKIFDLDAQRLFEISKIDEIKNLLHTDDYQRIVIDSITSFIYASISPSSIANGLDVGIQPSSFLELSKSNATRLIDLIKKSGITCMGIAQKIEGLPGDTLDNVSQFRGDGLIVLNYATIGKNLNRNIQVKKLRKTKIDGIPHNFSFTEEGITFESKMKTVDQSSQEISVNTY